jgi:hypothetical protein
MRTAPLQALTQTGKDWIVLVSSGCSSIYVSSLSPQDFDVVMQLIALSLLLLIQWQPIPNDKVNSALGRKWKPASSWRIAEWREKKLATELRYCQQNVEMMHEDERFQRKL